MKARNLASLLALLCKTPNLLSTLEGFEAKLQISGEYVYVKAKKQLEMLYLFSLWSKEIKK